MRSLLWLLLPVAGWVGFNPARAQAPAGRPLVVATYNVENLFDTLNHPGIQDLVLTPTQYRTKLANLGRVIGALQPDALALCEIENAGVLDDLLATPPLSGFGYRYVHYDSPDPRGIDVALLYRPERLRILASEPLLAPEHYATRSVLRVEALTEQGQRLIFYIVHLPSRRGNNARATQMRETLADSLNAWALREAPNAGVIVLGDLNDNPTSRLVTLRLAGLECTTAQVYRQGQGSYAWRDNWLLYDNILVRSGLRTEGPAQIFVRPWMLTPEGRFRGYPYRGIFSDHLPVYLRLLQ